MLIRTLLLFFLISTIFAPISNAQKLELWGMTTGDQGSGTIFKTDSVGENMELVYSFENTGKTPGQTHFVQYINKLYAVAAGGNYGAGVLFEFDPYNSVYIRKHSFDNFTTGSYPVGALCFASNGKLYGMCRNGGQYNQGVIYEYNPAVDSLQVIFNFDTLGSGGWPRSGLIQASNGKLYGMTNSSWSSPSLVWSGTLFEYDLSTHTFSKKIDFVDVNAPRPNIGARPTGELVQASNGKLYGMTEYGGLDSTINGGLIFEYDIIADTLIVKHSFSANSNPTGSFVKLSNGKMYGLSLWNIFEYNPSNNQFSNKYQYSFQNTTNGLFPVDRLATGSNGKLYGLCRYGGASNMGVLFEFNPQTNTYVKKTDFSGANGAYPRGGLFLASNGIFYGMLSGGGIAGNGIIFEYNNTSNILVKNYDFISAINGEKPYGSLLLASNGMFYGMTSSGGLYNYGVLFEFDPATSIFSKKIDFDTFTGMVPKGSLMQASNGKLYGMTSTGNSTISMDKVGAFFEYDIQSNNLTVKKEFHGLQYGGVPFGGLVEGDSSNLFGMTSTFLGTNGGIFQYNFSTATFIPRYGFGNYYSSLSRPEGTMIKVNNTMLMGLAKYGGAYGKGGLFAYYTTSKTTSLRASFNGVNGACPTGDLCLASNGKMYGLTSSGGSYNQGVLFEYTGVILTKKVDFNVASLGGIPHGSLMKASSGKLYGMTTEGGAFNKGILFEYNPVNSQFIIKHHFNGTKGAKPYYTQLVERDACANAIYDTISEMVCKQYISPSGKIWTQTGIYTDTLNNMFYCDSIITVNLIVSHVDTMITLNGATLIANFAGGIYQWIDCDAGNTMIQGANRQSFTPITNGHYAVIIVGNGCIDTSICYAVNTVGILETSFGSQIKIYPNPTSGDVDVEFSNIEESLRIVLRNAIGHIVMQKEYENTQHIELNISSAAGLYLLEIFNSQGQKVSIRIVKR